MMKKSKKCRMNELGLICKKISTKILKNHWKTSEKPVKNHWKMLKNVKKSFENDEKIHKM